tara:strand:- start:316 stop:495 length:180 start_codon:yes stop_codon:yes gene_type:complete
MGEVVGYSPINFKGIMIKVKFKTYDKDGNKIESKEQYIPETLYQHLLQRNDCEIIVINE